MGVLIDGYGIHSIRYDGFTGLWTISYFRIASA